MKIGLEDVLELGFGELKREPVKEHFSLPGDKNFTNEIGLYVARKLDVDFTKKLQKRLKRKTNYVPYIKDPKEAKRKARKATLKSPGTWGYVAPISFITGGGFTAHFLQTAPSLWPIGPLIAILGTYVLVRAFYKGYYKEFTTPHSSSFCKHNKRVLVNFASETEKLGTSAHEFTHFFGKHIYEDRKQEVRGRYRLLKKAAGKYGGSKKALRKKYKDFQSKFPLKNKELVEGVAVKVEADANYDYGFKERGDLRSVIECLRVYAVWGGRQNNEVSRLFDYCKSSLSNPGLKTTLKDVFARSLKKTAEMISAGNRDSRLKSCDPNKCSLGNPHSFGYVRTLLELEGGRTLGDLVRKGFSFDIAV